MTNGDAYCVSDNGRIRKRTGYLRDHVHYTDLSQRSHNNGDQHVSYQYYGSANLKQHSAMGMVRHMEIGIMITAQHVLIRISQVILDMRTPPKCQKSADRLAMVDLPQIRTIMISTVNS